MTEGSFPGRGPDGEEPGDFAAATDPRLAVLLHSVVDGTPAYRREFVAFDVPDGLGDFDAWLLRTVLNPQSPLFREARYLLAEETEIRDPALYHYRVTEPLITFYEVVTRPEWYRLEAGQAVAAWRDQQADFLSRVVGPHFETLCRSFVLHAASGLFGAPAGEVGSGIVNDPANRTQIEIDVAVLAPPEPGCPRRLLSLGEVKWGRMMTTQHTARLARARDLLASSFDTRDSPGDLYG